MILQGLDLLGMLEAHVTRAFTEMSYFMDGWMN